MLHYETGENPDRPMCTLEEREYGILELNRSYISHTATLVFRSTIYDSVLYKSFPPDLIFDVSLIAINAKLGRVYCFPEIMSVYRKHPGGVTDISNFKEPDYVIGRLWRVNELIGPPLNCNKKHDFCYYYQYHIVAALKAKKYKCALKALYRSLTMSPTYTLIAFVGIRWNAKKYMN